MTAQKKYFLHHYRRKERWAANNSQEINGAVIVLAITLAIIATSEINQQVFTVNHVTIFRR